MKNTTLAHALASALIIGATPAFAANDTGAAINEAKLEGQIGTAILLNRHLNPFEISVDVEGSTAVLTGTVDESIDKELAERVALNAKGIAKVDNQIKVDSAVKHRVRGDNDADRPFDVAVEDASITASVKSRLLWNDTTDGLDINVDTLNGKVTLEGTASTQAEKDLATRLAKRTDGVRSVANNIKVGPDNDAIAGGRTEARDVDVDVDNRTVAVRDGAGRTVRDGTTSDEPITDAWITAKVKSSLLMSANVDGLDINVDTKEGVVTLTGEASSSAERDLAVEIAKDIKGVKSVQSGGLKLDAGSIATR